MSLPAQSLTEDAATSSGFFLRSMAGPAPPPPPSPPGGLAVKRGGSAALSRQRCRGRAGGRCRHVGEVRGGHGARPGVVWGWGSAPGRASLPLGYLCARSACERECLWQVRDKSFRRPSVNVLVQPRAGAGAVTEPGVPWPGEAAVDRNGQECGLGQG